MEFKLGGIVRRNVKVLIILTVLSVPIMTLFQNCGKTQAISISDVQTSSKANPVVDTNELPMGDSQIDQIPDVAPVSGVGSGVGTVGAPASGDGSGAGSRVGSGDGSVSIGMPSEEEQEAQEIEDSLAACAALQNSSNSNNVNGAGVFSSDHKSASNIRGKHVISSANFKGNTQIDSISNSYGSLTVCGLDIGTLSNYRGKITLVNNSKIGVINSLNGQLVIIDGSGAKIRNSKVSVKKIN